MTKVRLRSIDEKEVILILQFYTREGVKNIKLSVKEIERLAGFISIKEGLGNGFDNMGSGAKVEAKDGMRFVNVREKVLGLRFCTKEGGKKGRNWY